MTERHIRECLTSVLFIHDPEYDDHVSEKQVGDGGYGAGSAVDYAGPVALRYPRGEAYEGLKQFRAPVEICYGKSEWLYEEEEIAIIFVGHMAELAEQVREGLKEIRVSGCL